MTEPTADHLASWEEHYSARPQIWSGRVNARLAEVVPQIVGNRALDLGCGEGADAIWLAERGWTVVAVDVSSTALGRARAVAASRGVANRIDFQQHELTRSFPDGLGDCTAGFDLVSAQFLHSTLPMDRPAILRRAAAAVAPGGALLIVDHAAAPPWASKLHHHQEFPAVAEVAAGLELEEARWERVAVGPVERIAHGPDGQTALLTDNVVWVRRAGPLAAG